MVGWHHRLNGHEFEQAPGGGDEQGSLACCSPWDRRELDTTEQLNCIELSSHCAEPGDRMALQGGGLFPGCLFHPEVPLFNQTFF